MHQYLQDTEYAVRNLIQLAHAEEDQLRALLAKLEAMKPQIKVLEWDFESSDLNDDFSDVYVIGAFSRMAQARTEANNLQGQIASLQASIGTRQQAIQAISGSILQVAKQGISLVHGGLKPAPEGRFIGTASLKSIIWNARDQAMHFEEGIPRNPAVRALFSILEAEQGSEFSLAAHLHQSRARQVINLLGWREYSAYVADMSSLLGP